MTRFTRSQIKSNPEDQANQDHQDDSVQHSDTTASRAAHSTTSTYPHQLGPFHSPSSTSSPSSFPPYVHYAQQQQAPQINVGGSPATNAPPPSTTSRRKSTGSGGGNRKGNPPERRAQHNAIERARRETLNARFLVSIDGERERFLVGEGRKDRGERKWKVIGVGRSTFHLAGFANKMMLSHHNLLFFSKYCKVNPVLEIAPLSSCCVVTVYPSAAIKFRLIHCFGSSTGLEPRLFR